METVIVQVPRIGIRCFTRAKLVLRDNTMMAPRTQSRLPALQHPTARLARHVAQGSMHPLDQHLRILFVLPVQVAGEGRTSLLLVHRLQTVNVQLVERVEEVLTVRVDVVARRTEFVYHV